MSKRSVMLLLTDIIGAIDKIERYTSVISLAEFMTDEKTSDAVIRNLEITGEASNRLPTEWKERYPSVEWKKIIGLRHRIVHDYFGTDLLLIWQIIQKDIPAFKVSLKHIIVDVTQLD